MEKKENLTWLEIKKDIIIALKNPPSESKSSYNRSKPVYAIVGLALLALIYFFPIMLAYEFAALILFAAGYLIFHYARLKVKIKSINISNYNVTTETVYGISEEHYLARNGGRVKYTKQISNYTVHFENGKDWRVPKKLYTWSERFHRQDRGVYHTTHRGDTMTVISEKATGEIVMAYNTDIFEYKGEVA